MTDTTIRRLPVYILLDVSGSMTGTPIEAVRQGVKSLLADLRNDPSALESAFLSVITFSDGAKQVAPLTDLAEFREPEIRAGGPTHLGAALKLLLERVPQEVRKTSETVKGDYRPIIFLLTDGEPTDDYEPYAQQVREAKLGNVIALACGMAAETAPLKMITDTVIAMRSLVPGQLAQFFRWVSSSIKTTSQSLGTGGKLNGTALGLPALPEGIQIVP